MKNLIDASEGLLKENDQDMNARLGYQFQSDHQRLRKTLRNNVAGSLYIGDSIDRLQTIEDLSKLMLSKSNLVKGSSGAVLSQAVLIIPSSIVIVQWNYAGNIALTEVLWLC